MIDDAQYQEAQRIVREYQTQEMTRRLRESGAFWAIADVIVKTLVEELQKSHDVETEQQGEKS